MICQTNLVLTIDNLLVDLLIHQTFFRQMLKKSHFAKLSCHTVVALTGLTIGYNAVVALTNQ